MIVKPTVTELLKKTSNRYELVIATSRRARQIAMGDEKLVKIEDKSPVTIAANEIAEGKVEVVKENVENENIIKDTIIEEQDETENEENK